MTARALVTARSMATSGPMPYDEDKMPIYALGVNIGMQISQQVNIFVGALFLFLCSIHYYLCKIDSCAHPFYGFIYQTDFKTLLEEDELQVLLKGFGDIVTGENTVNPMEGMLVIYYALCFAFCFCSSANLSHYI